jgi:hypothetical protein
MLRRVGLFVLGKGMRTLIPVLATGFVESQIERHRIHFHNRGDSPTKTTMPKSPPEDHETTYFWLVSSECEPWRVQEENVP